MAVSYPGNLCVGGGASIIAALGFNQSFLVSYARDCRAKIFGREKWGVWELRLRLGLVSPDWQQNYAAACLARALINELVD